MKTSYYSIDLELSMFFRNTLSFAMTVTTLLTVFTKEHWFSKKKLGLDSHKNAWNQRKVQSCKENKLLFYWFIAIFSEYLVISSGSNKVVNSVYKNNIDFLKNGRLNSHKNASNQRKVPSCKCKACYYSIDLQRNFYKYLVIAMILT